MTSIIGRGTAGVYQVRHVSSGKRYVGSSRDIAQRWAAHRSALRNGRHHSRRLQRAWDKYGQQAFVFELMLICSPENLSFYEQRMIEGFDAFKSGLNGTPVAYSAAGRPMSDEQRKAVGDFFRGRAQSAQQREAIAAANRGRKHTQATVEKIRLAKTGVPIGPLPKEHREAISRSLTGVAKSPEHIEKMAAFRHSDESKKRISEAKAGKKILALRNPEHTRRQQEARMRTLAAKRVGLGV